MIAAPLGGPPLTVQEAPEVVVQLLPTDHSALVAPFQVHTAGTLAAATPPVSSIAATAPRPASPSTPHPSSTSRQTPLARRLWDPRRSRPTTRESEAEDELEACRFHKYRRRRIKSAMRVTRVSLLSMVLSPSSVAAHDARPSCHLTSIGDGCQW